MITPYPSLPRRGSSAASPFLEIALGACHQEGSTGLLEFNEAHHYHSHAGTVDEAEA
jgi:hypothetical protein